MTSRLTAVLSITGVLLAGSAAAIVNAQVLQSSARDADSGVAFDASSATTVVAPVEASATSDTTPVTTSPPAATQAAYLIGDAGSVTLDTAGDVLRITSVTPNPGWTVTEAEQKSNLDIEVTFVAGDRRVQFKANLLFGVVGTSVEETGSGATGSSSPSSSIGDDHGGGDNSGPGSDDSGHSDGGSGDD